MASSLTKSRICVVDDDLDVLSSLRFLLETEGFDVRTFRSGAAMLDAAAIEEFDCFVIDFKMPNMTGITIANHLRDRKVPAPIILITGYPDQNIWAKATVAGIDVVLLKPDAEENLASQIRAAVQRNGRTGLR
ncbi:response regulator [Afipia sp. DC4300-2b1]|uniref:response regulator n=1 Tax=Afipia sp. DC4300-2b1 TaxID=2804672 RepID=UPI003CED5C6B